MVLTEATGDAELVLWDGGEFGHSNGSWDLIFTEQIRVWNLFPF